ncbi:probable glutamate receptor [Penaeus chinensis]|uniref:probable glutamate receptor n=1 Tax=Penaeus chinensis TaxID=139456 RepID=UPI001FB5D07F|nr:probable glutamate receptor [Penaeus chinensis]
MYKVIIIDPDFITSESRFQESHLQLEAIMVSLRLRESLLNPRTLRELLSSPRTFKFPDDVLLRVGGETSAYASVVKDPAALTGFALDGPLSHIIEVLARTMNFSYSVVQSPDRSFGAKLPNGSWTGLEVDIGLGPLTMSESRAEAVDFADRVTNLQLRVLAGKRSPELNPWGFLYPLGPLVWLGLVAALACVSAASLALGERSRRLRLRWYKGAFELFHAHLGILLRQDLPNWFSRGPEKMVVGSWMLVAMVVTMGYSSTLVSLLAARNIPQPINSLRELVDSDSVVVMKPKTAFTDFFENAPGGVYKEVGDLRHVGRVEYAVHQEHARILDTLVRGGVHTFIEADYNSFKLMADDFRRKGRCDFYQSRDTFLASPMSVVVPRGSPLLAAINHRYCYLRNEPKALTVVYIGKV